MRGCTGWIAAALLITAAPWVAAAGAAPAEAATAEIRIAGSQQFDMSATASKRRYRIFVSLPDKPAPADGYAVLYVMDGNAMFHTAREAVRAMERRPDVPRDLATIVVGVGYPDGVDIANERTFDLTPRGSSSARITAPTGGADAFLDFLQRDLGPRIAAYGKLDPARKGIFGHSFGGLFVLHSLSTQPLAFPVRVAASPSIWFADPDFEPRLQQVIAARSANDPGLKLLITAGEYEQSLSPASRALPNAARIESILKERAQVDNGRRLADTIGKAPGVRSRFDEIGGEDHGTVIPAAIGRAVAYLLMPPPATPPVPSAQDYMAMTAEQRYDLRLLVRELPDSERIPWLTRLKQTLHDGLSREQADALHSERNAMDQSNRTQPHAINAPGK